MINQPKNVIIQIGVLFLNRIVVFGGSESGKTNVLLNSIKYRGPNVAKIYLYVKDPFESKYQLLNNERDKAAIEKLKNPKPFIDYSQTIDGVYENLEDYNPTKKKRQLIMFYDITADKKSNKH